MGFPKIIWEENKSSQNKETEELKILIEKLQKILHENPENCKKASKILENWIQQSKP